MFHMNESCLELHINESCHTYACFIRMSHVSNYTWMSHVTLIHVSYIIESCLELHMNESCHTYACFIWMSLVLNYTWMSHVTHMHVLYEWVMSWITHEWVMSHICMFHMNESCLELHMNESCHTYACFIWMSHVSNYTCSTHACKKGESQKVTERTCCTTRARTDASERTGSPWRPNDSVWSSAWGLHCNTLQHTATHML